jgi:cytochrome P450
MTMATEAAVYWDPYRTEFWANPYPVFRRLREEAPLYYNEQHDFYAVSRAADVEAVFTNREAFSSSHGDILEYIKANMVAPKGMFIWEEPPVHTVHRSVLTRVFTPKRMNDLEAKIRAYCVQCLDPLVGSGGFDFITALGTPMPMRIIGMLLGIPEEDQLAIRERVDAALRTEAGKPMEVGQGIFSGQGYEEYIDWRVQHPSDDLMTELLQAEFKDETGTLRRLTREEVLNFVNLLAGAGNETTTRLIGWTGKVLSDHPAQRAELAANPALIPNAIEELLRFEPPGPAIARSVIQDVEIHGRKIPAGSAILMLVASANRDERRYQDGDRFDIHREGPPHYTFGRGIHSCLGSALARVEGRVALQELLKRFPEWTVDLDNAKLSSTSTVRGWDNLPVYFGGVKRTIAAAPAAAVAAPLTGEVWELTLSTPVGPQVMTLQVKQRHSDRFDGSISGEMGVRDISGKISGAAHSWTLAVTKPVSIKLSFDVQISGDAMTGSVKLGMFGKAKLVGQRK